MNAAFSYAVIYTVRLTCESPLRTGNAEGDIQDVLRDADGNCLLQGSSIAGALRQWVKDHSDIVGNSMETDLFGNQNRSGHLIVSDGIFEETSGCEMRPRLHIDGKTGTAAKGGKFDVVHIVTGAKLAFTLTWLGDTKSTVEEGVIEQLLSAIQGGEIRFGAQKTNGFGFVSLQEVRKSVYDLTKENNRKAWLNQQDIDTRRLSPRSFRKSGVRFVLDGRTDNLLVKSGAAAKVDENTVTVNITENGQPVIPGSSVKGAVRARAEYIVSAFPGTEDLVTELFGSPSTERRTLVPGKVIFHDVMLSSPRKLSAKRIRVNRFSGGVLSGGLFEEEAISGGFKTEIVVPANLSPEAYALLCYALRDLGCGFYNLGSGGAIGRGYINLQSIEIEVADEPKAKLIFNEEQYCSVEDNNGLLSAWMKAWKGRINA